MITGRRTSALLIGCTAFVLSACHSSEHLPQETGDGSETVEIAEAGGLSAAEPPPIEVGMAPPPGPYAPGFDAVHYEIAISLPDTGTFIRAQTTAHIRIEAPRQDTLSLDLAGLAVNTVHVDHRSLSFEHKGGKLHVPVPDGLESGDTLRVEVDYHGHPDDGLILGPNIHGAPSAFADNWPNRARFWFPSIDHPSDKATVSFMIEAHPGRQVIANGVLESDDDPTIWKWFNPEPIPTYTMVLGAAEFVVERLGTACPGQDESCAEVTTWLFPQDTAAAAVSFRRAADMAVYYSDLIAPFPYQKLAHVQSSTLYGGMENVTAIFYPQDALAAGENIELTVAHETAHQWFGDAVTESDWNHLWLSEGFASYFAALFFEEADGVDRFREIMGDYRSSYLASRSSEMAIVGREEDNLLLLLNTNNYYKGAWVLHMLRARLGDDVFFEGIRRYYQTFEHGTALTDDLRQALEAVSGEDLNNFFDQWIYQPGHPQIALGWSWDEEEKEVEVQIQQVQPEQWPAFEAPLVLEFGIASGSVRMRTDLSGRQTVARFDLGSEPTSLDVDPADEILMELVDVERVAR
jgi:aminopeptidase N